LATANLAFFPPLVQPRLEGDTISADRLQQTDNMAITASKFVASTANYATVTRCTSITDDACAQAYWLSTAENVLPAAAGHARKVEPHPGGSPR